MVRTLLSFVHSYRWVVPLLIVLGIAASIAEGIGIGLLIPFLDVLMPGASGSQTGVFVDLMQQFGRDLSETARLALIVAAIVALTLVKASIVAAYVLLSVYLNGRVNHSLRRDLFRRVLTMDFGALARRDQGKLFNVIHHETWTVGSAINYLTQMIASACMVAVFAVLLVLISWQMALVVMVAGVVMATVVRGLSAQGSRLGAASLSAYSSVADRLIEVLGSMRVVRVFGQEAREQARFDEASNGAKLSQRRIDFLTGVMPAMIEVAMVPLFVALLVYAWYAEVGIAGLLAFLMLVYRMQPHLKQLHQCRVRLATFEAPVAAVCELMASVPKVEDVASLGVRLPGLQEAVAFENVSFHYECAGPELPAVRDVSLLVAKGQSTALFGGSGAGKSTLINLLCGLYRPTGGEILVDGTPLHQLDLGSWRARLAIAGQDAELMAGTIRSNIAYGRPDAALEEIIDAARRADIHAFIETLPGGYDARIGPRGVTLSGGQRQRIGLARALLRGPDILILDEATNALDSLSEAEIQKTLERLHGEMTIIIIAHRFSALRAVDHVVVLDGGRVVEQGPPATLLGQRGLFARLHQMQADVFS